MQIPIPCYVLQRLNGDVCDLSKLLSETELNGEDASEVTKGEQGASEVEIIDKEVSREQSKSI